MSIIYSTYEAKARFSEILKLVRSGKTVTISYRGNPVAEIRSVELKELSTEERMDKLKKRGVYIPAKRPLIPFKYGERRPGALKRFLEDRNE